MAGALAQRRARSLASLLQARKDWVVFVYVVESNRLHVGLCNVRFFKMPLIWNPTPLISNEVVAALHCYTRGGEADFLEKDGPCPKVGCSEGSKPGASFCMAPFLKSANQPPVVGSWF